MEIIEAITGEFYDDLEFIEGINDITWARKVQLKAIQKLPNHP